MIDTDTRLRVGRGIGKTETEASTLVFETMKERRGHPEGPPPTVSDGWGGIREAMREVYGKVPEYKGIGRPPEKKRPQEGWQYLQIVKERTDTGQQVTGTRSKEVVYGEKEDEVLDLLGEQTAYVERTHLTMRHMNGRLTRRGLGFSKALRIAPRGSGLGGRRLQPDAPVENVAHGLGRTAARRITPGRAKSAGESARPQWPPS